MKTRRHQRAIFYVYVAIASIVPAQSLPDLRRAFEQPPDDARIMMRWWWFGPAVTKPQLEREMRRMKEGGIGGFEVQPVYPLGLDDTESGIRNLPYLSDEFLEALRFAGEKAKELGLRMDLTIGSGWPYGGPQVPIAMAAGRLRVERVPTTANSRRVRVPAMVAGEKLLAAFAADSRQELSDIRDGVLWLPEAGGRPAEVWFFLSGRTGQMVKRPAIGAEGYVLNHYDRRAVEHYLKTVGDPLLGALGSYRPYAVFCDSLEVYSSDWTADFLDEFQRRRGYDLKPHLPMLVVGAGGETKALRQDWGRTLTELLEERFFLPLRGWAQRHGTRFRIQGYGTPPATISSNLHADLPEGEGHHWKILRASRWAASASHLYDRPVTSSETWTWLHSPVFRATPLDVKAEADRHFLQGINQLIGHGWPYTPESVEYPGWRFYASAVFDDRNPWWLVMPDLSRYLQRLSFVLRQGRPANDVALYLPNSDAYARFTQGQVELIRALGERLGPDVVARILEAGYNLDFFDDGAVDRLGQRYRVVILPGVEAMPPRTLRKLEEFVRSGGQVIATRRLPDSAPGLRATESEHKEVRETARRIAELVTDENADLPRKLHALLRPDVSLSPAAPDMGFVHRATDFAEIYFLANTANVRWQGKATFRVEGLGAEWWDPLSGRALAAEVAGRTSGATTIEFDLEPYGSRVLVFSRQAPAAARPNRAQAATPQVLDISTAWKVTFSSGGDRVQMDRLRSWTDEEQTRYYSGLATYEKTITVPEGFLRPGLRVKLDLGEAKPAAEPPGPASRVPTMQALLDAPVREAAVVYINDQQAGSVWCPPYAVDVTRLLVPGENRIRIMVGSLAINHMAGRSLPDYRLLNLRYGVRFEAQDMDKVRPVPAGLLGPIRLVAG